MIIGIYFKTSYVKNKQIKPADDYMGHDYFKTSYVKNKLIAETGLVIAEQISKHLMLKTNRKNLSKSRSLLNFKTSYVKNKHYQTVFQMLLHLFQNILC